MGYTLRVRGLSISCSTIEELEKVVERYGESEDEPRRDRASFVEAAASPGPSRNSENGARTFRRREILAVVDARDEPVRAPEIADLLGATGARERGRVSASIFGLAKAGLLLRTGEGAATRYEMAERGSEYLRKSREDSHLDDDDRSTTDVPDDDEEDEPEGDETEEPPRLPSDGFIPESERQSNYRMPMQLNAARWFDEPELSPVELRVPAATSRERQPVPEGFTRDQWRSRRRHAVKSKTESIVRLSKTRLRLLGAEYPEDPSVGRPKTRANCAEVARPCPYVGCRHNLYLDVNGRTGAIKYNFPDREPSDMPEDGSCSLDVVEDHPEGVALEVVGEHLNLTRERVRQIEDRYWPTLCEGVEHLRKELSA